MLVWITGPRLAGLYVVSVLTSCVSFQLYTSSTSVAIIIIVLFLCELPVAHFLRLFPVVGFLCYCNCSSITVHISYYFGYFLAFPGVYTSTRLDICCFQGYVHFCLSEPSSAGWREKAAAKVICQQIHKGAMFSVAVTGTLQYITYLLSLFGEMLMC